MISGPWPVILHITPHERNVSMIPITIIDLSVVTMIVAMRPKHDYCIFVIFCCANDLSEECLIVCK